MKTHKARRCLSGSHPPFFPPLFLFPGLLSDKKKRNRGAGFGFSVTIFLFILIFFNWARYCQFKGLPPPPSPGPKGVYISLWCQHNPFVLLALDDLQRVVEVFLAVLNRGGVLLVPG